MSDFLFPERCPFCGTCLADAELICKECVKEIKPVGDDICRRCGLDKINCCCKIGDFAFDSNISSFYYVGPARIAVTRFKFHKKPQMSVILAKYIVARVRDKYKDFTFDFVTFVPTSSVKRFCRGYNAAELLAKRVAEALDLEVRDTLKSKFVLTPQKYLDENTRKKATKGRFSVKNKSYEDANILLIDDVMTTGSTLSECALMLKRAGARTVRSATFAITSKNN